MFKHEEINNPNSCLNRARNHELIFVLLARDESAPAAIRAWINSRIDLGKNKREDPQIIEALKCAALMDQKYFCVKCQWSGPMAKAEVHKYGSLTCPNCGNC